MIEYSARSHVGRVRGNNEDNLYADGVILTSQNREQPFTIDGVTACPAIFAVCDGMGGEENGEFAAMTAVQNLLAADSAIKAEDCTRLGETLQQLINDINESIHSYTLTYNKRAGTTLALAVITESGAYCFNMGDSRIYALHKDCFRQITNDYTPDGLAGSKLTRCIGIGDISTVEAYTPIPCNSRILLCSDGLTDMVSAAEIESILRVSQRTVNAADYLLNTALVNGGEDNITVIVADIKTSRISFLDGLAKKLKG